MNPRFSAKDFVAILNKGELMEKPLVKQGMVKPAEKPDALLFNEGMECGHWVRIPLNCIEEIEHLDTITCKDHQHPYVQVHFKQPKDDNPLAKVFMALASRELVRGEALPSQAPSNWGHRMSQRCRSACSACARTGHPGACAICDSCSDF